METKRPAALLSLQGQPMPSGTQAARAQVTPDRLKEPQKRDILRETRKQGSPLHAPHNRRRPPSVARERPRSAWRPR